jgi:hypothetical protein
MSPQKRGRRNAELKSQFLGRMIVIVPMTAYAQQLGRSKCGKKRMFRTATAILSIRAG